MSAPDPTPNDQRGDDDSFFVNVGRATDVLREDLTDFFECGLSHRGIYSENIVFVEPSHTHFRCEGLQYYRAIAETLRLSVRCYFDDVSLEITSMRQTQGNDHEPLVRQSQPHAADDQPAGSGDIQDDHPPRPSADASDLDVPDVRLVVRWTFAGQPRVSSLMSSPKVIEYQGVFEYRFDNTGRICEHRVRSIHPAPPFAAALRLFRGPAVDAV
nr:hypothetical protein HK105_004113 [Polyrhizophydium stewartii]